MLKTKVIFGVHFGMCAVWEWEEFCGGCGT